LLQPLVLSTEIQFFKNLNPVFYAIFRSNCAVGKTVQYNFTQLVHLISHLKTMGFYNTALPVISAGFFGMAYKLQLGM